MSAITSKEFLKEGLNRLKLSDCSENLSDLLLKYTKELEMFNSKFNLIKAENINEIITAHILDSLSAWQFFKQVLLESKKNVSIADIGSGAGFPGIPLACLFYLKKEEAEFTLIERMSRRCAMLDNVCAMLELKNTQVLNAEFEKVSFEYDIVTCRAFKSLDKEFLNNVKKCLKTNGKIFLYKGTQKKVSEEIEIIKSLGLKFEIKSLKVPFLNRERNLIILEI